jgi:Ser/Thr protein kinase RdoA (MazF antagonist)
VPSFDGRTWRLHSGERAAVVFEWMPGRVRNE